MLRKSAFVTTTLLDQIFNAVKELWTQKYITSVPGRLAAVIIVLDPAHPVEESHEPIELWSGILGEDDCSKWPEDRPWHNFAFAKARAAWRTKMSNHQMLSIPEMIQVGDFKYQGGIYVRNGLVVATSGLKTADEDVEVSDQFARMITVEVCKLAEASSRDKSSLFF